jgi:hypothetical protein
MRMPLLHVAALCLVALASLTRPVAAAGLYKLKSVDPQHSLKAPGFNPWTYHTSEQLVSSLCFHVQRVPLHRGVLRRVRPVRVQWRRVRRRVRVRGRPTTTWSWRALASTAVRRSSGAGAIATAGEAKAGAEAGAGVEEEDAGVEEEDAGAAEEAGEEVGAEAAEGVGAEAETPTTFIYRKCQK